MLINPKYFDFRYTNSTMSFDAFQTYIFDYGKENTPVMPHFYSGYQIYEANNITNQYKFYNFLNMTNQDAAGLYPQFMYEAILKSATRNPEFKFKVRNTPFP